MIVNETCPVPLIEFGSMKQAASVRLLGIVQVRLMREVKSVAVVTVRGAIAAEPSAAVTPGDASEKFEIVIGIPVETDSA